MSLNGSALTKGKVMFKRDTLAYKETLADHRLLVISLSLSLSLALFTAYFTVDTSLNIK